MLKMRNNELVYPELSFLVNGVIFQVRKELGRYKSEKQYCDAIENVLKAKDVAYERERVIPQTFPGEQKGRNRVDFIIEERIILEIKSKPFILKEDYYQARRYLDCFRKKLAILVNMRNYYVKPKRILNSEVEEERSFA